MSNLYHFYQAHPQFRRSTGVDQQVVEAVLSGLKRNASAIDLYSRLANEAPSQKHRHYLLYGLEQKKMNMRQFTEVYTSLTGTNPHYQIEPIPFPSYSEGLEHVFQMEFQGCQDCQRNSSLSEHPDVQNLFFLSFEIDKENALRLQALKAERAVELKDYGSEPFVVNIDDATKRNDTYRTALWTGENLQVTLMSIDVGDDIGLEVHPTTDQFLRIEEGQGFVQMGDTEDNLTFEADAYDDYAIMIPAGKWHNVTNTGDKPLKVYAIYAPPEHPFGTVHVTKADAMDAES
jgi:mannose-6-phosphate isomerase-like protein (cupin superfamily)